LIEGGGPASIYVCAKFEEAIIMQIEPIGEALLKRNIQKLQHPQNYIQMMISI